MKYPLTFLLLLCSVTVCGAQVLFPGFTSPTPAGFDSTVTFINLDFEEADSAAFFATHPHTADLWYMEPPEASGTGLAPTFSTTQHSMGAQSLKSYHADQGKSRLWW